MKSIYILKHILRRVTLLSCIVLLLSTSAYSQGGSIDLSFMKVGTGVNGDILKTLIQPDGKILIAGHFSEYNGSSRNHLMRLNTDGSLDTSFTIGTGFNGTVYAIALQPDNKIIVGGHFSMFNNSSFPGIVRLNTDGTLDNTFNGSASGTVTALKILPNNKILVASALGNLKRLNADGSTDLTFNTNVNNEAILDIEIQNDNKIIIVGEFTMVNGAARHKVARLNPDGSLDTAFNPEFGGNLVIYAAEIQTNQQIVLGGRSTASNGNQRGFLYRLNTNGQIDAPFATSGAGPNAAIRDLKIQPNGKIIIAGEFTQFNVSTNKSIARLFPDGTLDTSFNSQATISSTINALAIQPDQKIIIVGDFTTYSDILVDKIARINKGCTCE